MDSLAFDVPKTLRPKLLIDVFMTQGMITLLEYCDVGEGNTETPGRKSTRRFINPAGLLLD